MGDVSIRSARAEDREALVALWLDLVEHHRRLGTADAPAPSLRAALAEELARGIARERCRVLVAERDGAHVGFLFAEVEPAGRAGEPPAAGWIHELWVVPGERRNGIAAALVREADAFFAARGVRRVSVRVESANADALEYWARRGFVERARVLERLSD
ncbi:MAG TPA: GNAT family N-acetyltransferase [Myxococcota bacterium]|nr:GNAT family N-acetyltransferase [Myxococcota bacterium]